VLLTATWNDPDTNGLDVSDTLVLAFSETLVDSGVGLSHLVLPVTADTLGASTVGVSGSAITVTLAADAVFTPGGTYAQAVLGQGKPSGIRILSGAPLADGVGNAVVPGTTATARDIDEVIADLALVWNDNGLSTPKAWAAGNMVTSSTKDSPAYYIRNIGASTVVLTITGSDTANWTLQSAPGVNQFAVAADPGLPGTFALSVPGTLSARLFSGRVQDFAVRLLTPTSTGSIGVQQSLTLTITASVY
jgi:hypothetical protein